MANFKEVIKWFLLVMRTQPPLVFLKPSLDKTKSVSKSSSPVSETFSDLDLDIDAFLV